MRDPHVSDDLMLLSDRRMSVMENFKLIYGCFWMFINTPHKVHTIEDLLKELCSIPCFVMFNVWVGVHD